MRTRLLLLLALTSLLFGWRLGRPGFSDTEGMFAEPAREMAATNDWVTPRMNGEPFFTKPPLMYWLPAALFVVEGPTELARVWPAAAALATVAATVALGAELLGATAGLAAGMALATSAGFFMEARMLRADMVLVLTVTLALYLYVRLERRPRTATALAFWATMAVGVLDKGFLAVVLPGAIIASIEISEGALRPRTIGRRLRALHAPIGVPLLLAIALPWHVVAAARNPGFLWDYVVNQHVLVFFDKKLPRDSIPDTLGFFWTMFVVRSLPWSLFLPAAAVHARRLGQDDPMRARFLRIVVAWLAVVLGFFSLASSRLEHYSLPTMPATALLIGGLFADAEAGRLRIARAWMVIPPAVVGIAAMCALPMDAGRLLESLDQSLGGFGLEPLVPWTAAVLGAGLLGLASLLALGHPRGGLALAVCTAAALLPLVQLGHERVESLFSWKPFAEMVNDAGPRDERIFFRASDEYQLCGGLEYYVGRRLDLLAPPGWVPPTFLEGRTQRLFTPVSDFRSAWAEGAVFFVSDDVDPPGAESRLLPGPYQVIGRAGGRVVARAGHGTSNRHDSPGPSIPSR
jgi:4-amino-4-deoxy-L-arabinose transferase-like glycosyltransferase